MKALVFGGSGFLGSHVVGALKEGGHTVTVFDRKPSPYLEEGERMLIGDVQNQADVDSAVRSAQVVYNFAGIADIQEAHHQPLETVRSNVLGNCVVLEACAKYRVKRYVFASTL